MPYAEADPVLSRATQWPVHVRPNRLIYAEGDDARSIYRLDEGCVRLSVLTGGGAKQIVRFVVPGQHFGFEFSRRATIAESIGQCTMQHISLSAVLDLCKGDSDAWREILNYTDLEYHRLSRHLHAISHLGAMERLEFFMDTTGRALSFGLGNPHSRYPSPSQIDVAGYLGMAPEVLSRCLKLHRALTRRLLD